MSVHYHLGKGNVVADALSRLSMGRISYVDDGKKDMVKDLHRQARISVRLMPSSSGDVSVHPSSESSYIAEG